MESPAAVKVQPPPVAPKPIRQIKTQSLNTEQVQPTPAEAAVTADQVQRSLVKRSSEKELEDLTSKLLLNMEQASTEPEFVGVCSRCHTIIKGPNDGCTAMDKFYHSTCFTCEVCNRSLSGHSFYAVEDKVMCEGCYVNTLEKCQECNLPVTERVLRATGKAYHPECFTCTHCKKNLDGVPFTVDAFNKVHCIEDFHMKYAPRCSVCKQAILPDSTGVETVRVVALDRNFHVTCYKCEDCGVVMSTDTSDSGCFPLDGHLLCKRCNSVRGRRSLTSSSGTHSPPATTDM